MLGLGFLQGDYQPVLKTKWEAAKGSPLWMRKCVGFWGQRRVKLMLLCLTSCLILKILCILYEHYFNILGSKKLPRILVRCSSPDRTNNFNVFYEETNYKLICQACQKHEVKGRGVGQVPLTREHIQTVIDFLRTVLAEKRQEDLDEAWGFEEE